MQGENVKFVKHISINQLINNLTINMLLCILIQADNASNDNNNINVNIDGTVKWVFFFRKVLRMNIRYMQE